MARTVRRAARVCGRIWVVLGVCVVSALLAGPAFAHGDEGKMQLEATPSGSLQAFVRATVIFENDNEPALGAAVAVDAVGPDGQTVAATSLVEAGDGRYEATLTFPVAGAWTVRATATDPTATGEVTVTATEAVAAVTTTTAPAIELDEPRGVTTSDEDDDGSSLAVPIIAIVVLGIGGAAGAWLLQHRRRSS